MGGGCILLKIVMSLKPIEKGWLQSLKRLLVV